MVRPEGGCQERLCQRKAGLSSQRWRGGLEKGILEKGILRQRRTLGMVQLGCRMLGEGEGGKGVLQWVGQPSCRDLCVMVMGLKEH